jgi:hypothetical protein
VHLPPDVKEAVGRAIVRGTALIESFLRQRGVPLSIAQDVALECAFITYRSIAKGTLALPPDVEGYDQKLPVYMRTVAWRLIRNHKRAGDIFLRHERKPGTEVIVARTYDVEPALELASEIAAETPKARRVLLAMLETGNGPSGAAAAAGMKRDSGKWAMRAARKRAAKRLASV